MNHFTQALKRLGFFLIIIPIFIVSCGKQKFATGKLSGQDSTSPITSKTVSNPEYSKFTLVKPPVDFLFLIDNSGSFQSHLNKNIKEALTSLFNYVSEDFDYQILIAPILPSSTSDYWVIDYDSSNLNGISSGKIIPLGEGKNKILSFTPGSGQEKGLDRTRDLLSSFYDRGVFRRGAHTMVTLISNGDHYAYSSAVPYDITHHAPQKYYAIRNVIAQKIQSMQFRFFSIVPHTAICGGIKPTYGVYKRVSELFYGDIHSSFKSYPTPNDTYDICNTSDFRTVFNSINNTIRPETLRHEYDYWPIVLTNNSGHFNSNDLDSNNMTVTKILPTGVQQVIPESSTNGYTFHGFGSNLNIREKVNGHINRGEPYTGFFIKLHGTAKVVNPEYIKVKTNTKKHYYGYIKFDYKPEPSSIRILINGREIAASEFEVISGATTRNIRIASATSFAAATPAVNRTGWFVKLKPSAVYSNSSSIQVYYFPTN